MQRIAFSLLQTFIKQVDLLVVCKDNNSVSGGGDRRRLPELGDRRLVSRLRSMNAYSFLGGAVIDPYLLHIIH